MIKRIFLGLTLLTCCVTVFAQETIIQEAIAQEAENQGAANQEAARQEAARQEAAKQEAAKQEAAKQEAAKQEAAKQAATDPDKDRQYVTDELRLSMYSRASSSSKVVKLLSSGDLLEIEQIQGPYALVTGPGGIRGWVKRGFLVTKPTSNILLSEEQKKTASLSAEIEKLSNSKVVIDQYEKDMDKLVGQIDALEAEKQEAKQSIEDLQQELEEKQRELDRKDEDSAPALLVLMDVFLKYWKYIVPMILVIILLSYLVSKVFVEARIKSKFHGIKVW